MRLNFGDLEFDVKGLPRIFSLRVSPSYASDHLIVSILLDSCQRAAVAKWAARLGVEVVDCKPYQSRPGDRWTHTFEAVREVEGYKVRVWTSLDMDAPAAPVEASAAASCPCGCTAADCRCCDAPACACGPVCPVCDQDGGE